jgi:hypothetical protein
VGQELLVYERLELASVQVQLKRIAPHISRNNNHRNATSTEGQLEKESWEAKLCV